VPSGAASGRKAIRWLTCAPLLVLSVLLVLGGPAGAQAVDPVTVVDGSAATLPPSGQAKVTVLLEPAAGAELGQLRPRVVRLRREQVEVPIPEGLTAGLEPATSSLVLTVPVDGLTEPGAYSAVVALEGAQRRQLLTVVLTRAAGQLVVPASVTVRRTTGGPCWSWISGCDDRSLPRLTVRQGRDTRLLDLSAVQLEAERPQVEVGEVELPTTPWPSAAATPAGRRQ
jgi:hypothetical protein